jgi:peptidoglycan/xylan/chitin deacetylase (PgdA/CDA1 family)
MRIRGMKTVWRTATWLRSQVIDSVLILGYHRVAAEAVDPYELCIHPDHFAQHLDLLQRMTNVIDLETLRQGLIAGALPPRAVVITFDDGYTDILHKAAPLLAERGLPATVFIVSGVLGQEFWWDKLARIIFNPAILPDRLDMQIGTEPFAWSMLDSEHLTLQKGSQSPRHRLLHQLHQRLVLLPEARSSVLNQLQAWAETVRPVAPAAVLTMTSAELQTLANHDHITIGAHTETHPLLGELPTAAQQAEIGGSKTYLESLLQRPIPFFSYPHGNSPTKTQHLVEKAGFGLACTSGNDVVHSGSNLFRLPRFWLPNWNGAALERWLGKWQRH